MSEPTQDLLSFIVNQGVAIAVLAFLLVRLEARMARLETLLQVLSDRAYIQAGGQSAGPPQAGKSPP